MTPDRLTNTREVGANATALVALLCDHPLPATPTRSAPGQQESHQGLAAWVSLQLADVAAVQTRTRPIPRVRRPPGPACKDAGGRGGRERARYFFPMVTVAVPAGETQPAAEISVTDSVTFPLMPAVKVMRFVPWPAVIVPFEILQLYWLPAWLATEAVRPA